MLGGEPRGLTQRRCRSTSPNHEKEPDTQNSQAKVTAGTKDPRLERKGSRVALATWPTDTAEV